jgi:hypothetical protein
MITLLIIGNKTSVKNTIHQETKGYPFTKFYSPKQNIGTMILVNPIIYNVNKCF